MGKSENILAFEAAMKGNKELQEKFAAAQKRIVESKEAKSDGEILVKAAAEVGFTLTVEDFERALAGSQEVSDEELDMVSGGAASSSDYWCWVDYYCYWVLMHDEDGNKDRACFDDYCCIELLHTTSWL